MHFFHAFMSRTCLSTHPLHLLQPVLYFTARRMLLKLKLRQFLFSKSSNGFPTQDKNNELTMFYKVLQHAGSHLSNFILSTCVLHALNTPVPLHFLFLPHKILFFPIPIWLILSSFSAIFCHFITERTI